ncbi:MAG: hypothetical protein PUC73_06040, partial [Lachnospiraceae bacterium]|nr:hypothetical protein [Lachnospiraceae bacterium]
MEHVEKKRKKRKRMTGKMQTTLWVVFCLFLVGTLFVMIRVVVVGGNTGYAKASLSQKTGRNTVLQYKRGDILDRNGTVLAKSDKVYHLILDSRLLMNNQDSIDPTIRALCGAYGYEETELRALIEEKKSSAYYRLRKYMSYEEM